MGEDQELELLRRVNAIEDFFGAVLHEDNVNDWGLVRDLGQFLVKRHKEEFVSHLILVRACRRPGDISRATEEMEPCRILIASGTVALMDLESFLPALRKEEDLLGKKSGLSSGRSWYLSNPDS